MNLRSTLRIMLLSAATAVSAQAQTPAPAAAGAASDRVVVTTGQATVHRPPDRAFVTLATETRAPKPAEAQQRNAQAMTAVLRALGAAGVPTENIRTLGYSLDEEYEYANNRRTSKGFRAVNTIEVRLDDISRVGEILDVAVGAGATSAQNVRFDLKERDAAERLALRLAVVDARARADAAAAGADATVVTVIRIEEQGPPTPFPHQAGMMRAAVAGAPVETPVNVGDLEFDATVTLTVTIK